MLIITLMRCLFPQTQGFSQSNSEENRRKQELQRGYVGSHCEYWGSCAYTKDRITFVFHIVYCLAGPQVLETCVKNCGHRFHVLVASQEFIEGVLVQAILPKNNPPTALHERVLSLIQVQLALPKE